MEVWDAIELLNERKSAAQGAAPYGEINGQEADVAIRLVTSGLDLDADDLTEMATQVAITHMSMIVTGDLTLPASLRSCAIDTFAAGVLFEQKRRAEEVVDG